MIKDDLDIAAGEVYYHKGELAKAKRRLARKLAAEKEAVEGVRRELRMGEETSARAAAKEA